jgi:hypothetical protein
MTLAPIQLRILAVSLASVGFGEDTLNYYPFRYLPRRLI